MKTKIVLKDKGKFCGLFLFFVNEIWCVSGVSYFHFQQLLAKLEVVIIQEHIFIFVKL